MTSTATAAHVHSLDCSIETVATIVGPWTTLSAEFACAADVTEFEAILDLEAEVRTCRVSLEFAPTTLSDRLHEARRANLVDAQSRLFAAVAELTDEQAVAFGAYRLTR